MSELSGGLGKALRGATKKWKKDKIHSEFVSRTRLTYYRQPSYRVTVRSAAFKVMQAAYEKASSNGKYWANARQIMYAARPEIIKLTGESSPWKNSSYFTQQLLKDYIEENSPDWKIVWDARGHFREPYTDETIGVGGAEVKEYIGKWHSEVDENETPEIAELLGTTGPANRFSAVMFIEKEGFQQLFEEEHIAEEFDLAIMSTKGLPVGASCELTEALARQGVTVYCLHDFDLAGFKIIKTLREGTRLFHGCKVVELGLRMEDIAGLASENVDYKQGVNPKLYLRECGATEEERNFLVSGGSRRYWSGQRVELNAMTSEQLITWLKAKLTSLKVKKYIPGDEALKSAYVRARRLISMQEKIEEIEEEEVKEIAASTLRSKIKKVLKEGSVRSWDGILWEIAQEYHDEEVEA